MSRTVKQVAAMARITVRALHHYDSLGVLRPSRASSAGYRLYEDGDVERLQQILFFRELGFGLVEIGRMLDSPSFDRRRALEDQRRLLLEKRARLNAIISSVDRTMAALDGGSTLRESEMFEGFDQSQLEEYRDEARKRWGDKEVDDSWSKASKYTKADWSGIQAETEAIEAGIGANSTRDPADPVVQALVERWFNLINDRHYDCSSEIFRGLGDLYVQDERFTGHYDKRQPGLAAFMRAAMHEFCDKKERDQPVG